jgi:DedD protein
MDEVLKRRLAGALVLIVAAFVLSLLLPRPGEIHTDADSKRVTLDLTGSDTLPQAAPATPTPVPPVIASAAVQSDHVSSDTASIAANEADAPQIEEPPAEAPKPAAVPALRAVAPKAGSALPAASNTEIAKAEHKPALKLDDALTQEPAAQVAIKPDANHLPKAAAVAVPAAPHQDPPRNSSAPAVVAKSVATPPAKTRWYVQAGAFTDIGNAHQVMDKLNANGLKGIISPLDSDKGTRYRVRIGPFSARDQAKMAQERAAKLGYANGSLVED